MPEIVEAGPPRKRHGADTLHESLRGQLSISDMGTGVVRKASVETESIPRPRINNAAASEGLAALLVFIHDYFLDSPYDVTYSAADSVLSIMRDSNKSDTTKKEGVQDIVGERLSSEKFNELYNLCQSIPHSVNMSYALLDEDGSPNFSESDEESSEDDEDEDSDRESFDTKTLEWVPINKVAPLSLSGAQLSPHDVTRTWLASQLEPTGLTVKEVMSILERQDIDAVRDSLEELIGAEHQALLKTLVLNRDIIFWRTKLHRAESAAEREELQNKIRADGLEWVLNEDIQDGQMIAEPEAPTRVDLTNLQRTTNVHAVAKVALPPGSTKFTTPAYEQYNVPPIVHSKLHSSERPIADLPIWAQPLFAGIAKLNPVQSKVSDAVLDTDENVLVCAPTGAGKTNIALMAIARCLEQRGSNKCKVIYLSPLKALVQEQVRTFTQRLGPLGLEVCELSGDNSLNWQQLEQANVIVSTPEKWDVVSRKATNASLAQKVNLLVIDEIHLLHDKRGPVLENIVARIEHNPKIASGTRLLGLSATLPNYEDIAEFLRASEETTFAFGPEYRPCPLSQIYLGVTDANPVRRLKSMDEACFDKVVEARENGSQVIVFVQSRKDTVKTAQSLLQRAIELGRMNLFASNAAASIFEDETLQHLVTHGLGVHHAGLDRTQRTNMELQFTEGKIQVLVSTATLAWGVNLPAHTVIIKGTTFYDPQTSAWEQLAPQDVIQMLGRAGRPGFDVEGVGIIITDHSELNYYMSIANASLPIESQLISRLVDSVNAEICNGGITSLDQGVDWLACTYLYVRMRRAPQLYRVQELPDDSDPTLIKWRRSLVYSAFLELENTGCLYPASAGKVIPTDLGRVSADFYIMPESVSSYAQQLKPWLGIIDVFRIFARSKEFENIPVRKPEQLEIVRLANLVPVPIREEPTSKSAKIQVLLQAYICRLGLKGFALAADMSYIAQSASRLFRAMFEIAVVKRWANLATSLLDIYKIVDHRMWLTSSPFRQFKYCSNEIIKMAESSQMPWNRYFDLETPAEVGEALRNERLGAEAFSLLQQFPNLNMSVQVRPLTSTTHIVLVDIEPRFEWNKDLLGNSQLFYLSVEDCEGNLLYAWEPFILKHNYAHLSHFRSVPVLLEGDPGPYLFVKLNSERWLQCSTTVSADLRQLVIPSRMPPPTPISWQEQLVKTLDESDASVYLGTPSTSLVYIEKAIESSLNMDKRILFVTPNEDKVGLLKERWANKFPGSFDEPASISVVTAESWELLTRRWKSNRKTLLADVVICDCLHAIGGLGGDKYEAAICRTRYWATQMEHEIRFIGTGLPLASVRSLTTWLGMAKQSAFNFVDRVPEIEFELVASPRGSQQRYQENFALLLESARKNIKREPTTLVVVPDRQLCKVAAEKLRLDDIECTLVTKPESALQGNVFVSTGAVLGWIPLSQMFDTILIVDTQFWDGAEYRFVDYPAADILEICTRALSRAVVYTHSSKRDYYAKFLSEPLPVESNLPSFLVDLFASEVANGVVKSGEDAVDLITYSFFFQRLRANPSYYGLKCAAYSSATTDEEINDFLSELIESSLEELIEANMIELTDEDAFAVSSLNGSQVVARDGVSVRTVSALQSLTRHTKEAVLSAITLDTHEFDGVVQLTLEDSLYSWLASTLPFGGSIDTTSTGQKALALLQLHMSRIVPPDLVADAQNAVRKALALLSAAIDVFAGEGNLSGTLTSLDLHQQLTQALWSNDSQLMQLPHVDSVTAARCADAGIASVLDFLTIEDDEFRERLLGFGNDDPRMVDVAHFANNYPSIDIKAKLLGPLEIDAVNSVEITIDREIEEDEKPTVVSSVPIPRLELQENWYILVGDSSTNELFGRSKVLIDESEKSFTIEFLLPQLPSKPLTLWCICDSYIDADKEVTLEN